MRGKKRIGQLKFGEELRRWERMREDVEFCLLENVRSYLRITEWLTSARKPLEIKGFWALYALIKQEIHDFYKTDVHAVTISASVKYAYVVVHKR